MPATANSQGTIFAISSGVGRSAVAIVRVSGPSVRESVELIAGSLPEPRKAVLKTFRNPATGEMIDRGLALFFPGPKSFTGEDCAEFHIHGGRASAAAMIEVLGAIKETRPADPGEFARRALVNGKMDLAAIEGLGDLIDAETEWQRRAALRQAEGALGREAQIWRGALIEALALLEAEIDFPEEEDTLSSPGRGKIAALLSPVFAGLKAQLSIARESERLREGVQIVIAGPPNAGKSALLNALTRRDVAIVSPFAGTTRDTIEVHLDLGGCPLTLIDTAGLRECADAIEEIGIFRAREKAKSADLVLWLSEARAAVAPAIQSTEIWAVFTKSDLLAQADKRSRGQELCISAKTGENIDLLLRRLEEFAHTSLGDGCTGLIARERHRQCFAAAAEALARILDDPNTPAELAADDLRHAIFALQRLTGAVDVEDILDEIFSRFCIGK